MFLTGGIAVHKQMFVSSSSCTGVCMQVSVCPGGRPTGYTYFIPSEERLESRILTRGFMESRLVVSLAGR